MHEHVVFSEEFMSLKAEIVAKLIHAMHDVGLSSNDPIVKVSSKPEFGDYQANFAMGLAKERGENPRVLAQKVVEHLDLGDTFEKVEVAGPGFINLHLKPEFIAKELQSFGSDERLGVPKLDNPEVVVVDYGGPNVAKEMHVGHLRSLVIGDAIVRVLDFMGNTVIRQNHIGDWGTQFGMLIQNILDQNQQSSHAEISDLNVMYQAAKQRYDSDEDFAKRARERVVLLQAGDQETLALWQKLVEQSKTHFTKIYHDLSVCLEDNDYKGESWYNPRLPVIVKELADKKLAEQSEGATVVFLEGFVDKDNKPMPFIIQKSDGGYLYATTDLAAINYRLNELHADRLIYVIDARQSQHMSMLFATARKAGWVKDDVRLEHAAFGSVLGEDHRPFKTRSGETVKLRELLEESEQKAFTILKERRKDLKQGQIEAICQWIAIAAIKYGDLSSDRVKDYVFSWERILSFEGNSAPYIFNSYARIRSIFWKEHIDDSENKTVTGFLHKNIKNDMNPLLINEPSEKKLALKLLMFPEVILLMANDLAPHHLCHYLFDLSGNFHSFYENCPILKVDNPQLKISRLLLCAITREVLRKGLELLGLRTIENLMSSDELLELQKIM